MTKTGDHASGQGKLFYSNMRGIPYKFRVVSRDKELIPWKHFPVKRRIEANVGTMNIARRCKIKRLLLTWLTVVDA